MAEALREMGAKLAISAWKQNELDAGSRALAEKNIEALPVVNDLGTAGAGCLSALVELNSRQ